MSQTYGTPSSGGTGGDGDQATGWTTTDTSTETSTSTGIGTDADTGIGGSGLGTGDGSSTRDVASEEARGVADDVRSAGQQTAATARDQAAQVAGEAKVQARQVLDQAKQELDSQVRSQHQRAAGGLNALADEIKDLLDGNSDSQGIAHDLAQQASDRVREAAQWLELRQPGDVLDEARSFARRRPGAFLAGAAVLGLIGGRLTRGLADEARDDSNQQSTPGYGGTAGAASGTETAVAPVTPVAPAVPGQYAYDRAPDGLSSMSDTTESSLDDPASADAPGSGHSGASALDDPLTDTTRSWGGESSSTYGEEKR